MAVAEVDAANTRANELGIQLDAAELKAREADRLASELETIATRFQNAKDAAAAELARANERVRELEAALHEAIDERAALIAEGEQSKKALTAAHDKRLRELETALKQASDERSELVGHSERVRELERALHEAIDERAELVAKIAKSEKALTAAQKAVATASKGDDGAAAQLAADLELARAEAAELRAQIEAANAEITKLRAASATPPPEGMRRHAMAELSAIAGATGTDDLMPRRR
jgi:DNA repair exonuclease SbcCD ATPase subunit